MKAVKSATNPDSAVRVLKTGTCPSLSGKSQLTYQIGCEGKSDIQFRISANSSSGFFSDDWVALSDIQEVLNKVPSGEPYTSFVLLPLFRGRSMNMPGFMFAALKQEGLVLAAKDKKRCYEHGDTKGFLAAIKVLNEDKPQKAEVKQPIAPPKKTPSKTSAKKKA